MGDRGRGDVHEPAALRRPGPRRRPCGCPRRWRPGSPARRRRRGPWRRGGRPRRRPPRPARTAAGSVTSPRCSRSPRPLGRRCSTVTSSPRAARASATAPPSIPEAPVTRTFIAATVLTRAGRRPSGSARFGPPWSCGVRRPAATRARSTAATSTPATARTRAASAGPASRSRRPGPAGGDDHHDDDLGARSGRPRRRPPPTPRAGPRRAARPRPGSPRRRRC